MRTANQDLKAFIIVLHMVILLDQSELVWKSNAFVLSLEKRDENKTLPY